MNTPKNKPSYFPPDDDECDEYYMHPNNVVSSNECTGLTVIPPEDEDEVDSYNDIYDIPLTPNTDLKKFRK